jgi:hypothetical protein
MQVNIPTGSGQSAYRVYSTAIAEREKKENQMFRSVSKLLLSAAGVSLVSIHLASCGDSSVAGQSEPAAGQPSEQDQVTKGPTRRALLIGISDYFYDDAPEAERAPGWKVKDLRGAVNDIRLMKQVLIQRFAFEEQNITMLEDGQATRKAMLAELKKIVAETGPEDVVYIHFSGHGSRVDDTDGDEEDKKDETLVPYDGRTGDVPDITDDEMYYILKKLDAKDALVVLDSCHSGTATRGESDVQDRWVGEDSRVALYAAAGRGDDLSSRGDDSAESRGDGSSTVLSDDYRYVLITGAAAEQTAKDSKVNGSEFYGWLSWSLATSLSELDQSASANRVHRNVLRKMVDIGERYNMRAPRSQLEAPEGARGRPLLGGEDLAGVSTGIASRVWVAVDPSENNEIKLRQGPLFGAAVGSTWQVFAPGVEDFDEAPMIARAVVIREQGSDSVAKIEGPETVIASGSRAVFLAPAPPETGVAVWLDQVDPADKTPLMAAVRAKDSDNKISFVGRDEPARFVVDIEDRQCRVYGPGGLQELETFPVTDWPTVAERLSKIFIRASRVADLMELDNPAGQIDLRVRISPSEDGQPRQTPMEGGEALPTYRVRRESEERSWENSLIVEVTVDQDAYVTVVSIDGDGDVKTLFPNVRTEQRGYFPEGRVPAGTTARFPDSYASPNKAGFRVDHTSPGRDTIRVFAASDLETAQRIRSYIGRFAQGPQSDGRSESFRKIYASADVGSKGTQDGLIARGNTMTFDDDDANEARGRGDWVAASVTYLVTE